MLWDAAIFMGGYVACIYSWSQTKVYFGGAVNEAERLRKKARELEAKVRARL